MTDLPLAVMVTGAPGSGKSTLAELLARELDLPLLARDGLVHGVWRTRQQGVELGPYGYEMLYRTMELWADLGVSFVADAVLYRGVSEDEIARRLRPAASVVQIHCRSRVARRSVSPSGSSG